MPDNVWTVGERSGVVKRVSSLEKIPYVALQRQNDKMTDSQKEGVRVWNMMVTRLRELGEMEDKQ